MVELLKRLIVLIKIDEKEVDTSELIYETVGLFIEKANELSIDEYYTIREYLTYKSSLYDLPVDDFQDLRSVTTLDELITMLQIPKIILDPRRFYASRNHYTKESDLYDDLRNILLNKDSFKRNHKDYIHNLALKTAREVLNAILKSDIQESPETDQFTTLLKTIIQAYKDEEKEEYMLELESRLNNQRREVAINSIKELVLNANTEITR